MRARSTGSRAAGLLHTSLLALAALTVLFMMTLTGIDVVGRYVLDRPVGGAFELTEFAMAISVFSVLPLVSLDRTHITADLLLDRASPGVATAQRGLADLCGLALFAVLTWRLWREAGETAGFGTTAGILELPLSWLTFYCAGMSALTTLVFAAHLAGLTRRPDAGARR